MSKIDINSHKRISFDLDKTIANKKTKDQSYENITPLPGAVETLQKLKEQDWYIIINTARNMRTYEHNTGAVIAKQVPIIIEWLKKWNIPYDEIWVKPHCSYFVDDKAIEFISWENFKEVLPKRIVQDKIEEWHDSDTTDKTVYEYLGWTLEQYANYVENGIIPENLI